MSLSESTRFSGSCSCTRCRLPLALLACVLFAIAAQKAAGMFIRPPDAPVDRLIKNTQAYINENPKDSDGYYTLARLHYLAFWLKTSTLKSFDQKEEPGKKLPRLPDDSFQRMPGRPGPGTDAEQVKPPTDEQLIVHLKAAIENYRKAIEMDPKKAVYHLGLAGALEQGAAMSDKLGLVPGEPAAATKLQEEHHAKALAKFEALINKLGDKSYETRDAAEKELRGQVVEAMPFLMGRAKDNDAEIKARVAKLIAGHWTDKAVPSYLEAYKLAIAKDLEIKSKPLLGLKSLVGYEAGQGYVRLVKARGETDAEKEQIAKIEADMKTLDGKPIGPITPIVFSLDGPARLDDLIDPAAAVAFNLDGTWRGQRWQWVKPETGILVWDPKGTGQITSGWQLFGSVSFFMFWSDGYRAMDALDDNRDGKLEGDELKGLAVWFDRNSNGRTDPGEVVPVEKIGIRSISVRATGKTGDSPSNSTGLITTDGRVLPTYDWIAQPAR